MNVELEQRYSGHNGSLKEENKQLIDEVASIQRHLAEERQKETSDFRVKYEKLKRIVDDMGKLSIERVQKQIGQT